jgi:hypothetical protein
MRRCHRVLASSEQFQHDGLPEEERVTACRATDRIDMRRTPPGSSSRDGDTVNNAATAKCERSWTT